MAAKAPPTVLVEREDNRLLPDNMGGFGCLQSVGDQEESLTSASSGLWYTKTVRLGEEAREYRCGGESAASAQHVP
jgi:hypothetical protein